jgi:hypothetical protein
MNEYLVITWTDSVPAEDGLAEAARDGGCQLLAAAPAHVAEERDLRPAPAGVVIACFSMEAAARSWFDAVAASSTGRPCSRPVPPRRCGGRLRTN